MSIKVEDLENVLVSLLKEISPKKECLNLFINYIYRNYHERVSRLNKIKAEADVEIERLKIVRKQLVEKNLAGIYSDEIFKEQSSVIEDQITKQQIVKEDTTFDNYNVDNVTSFLKTRLADLGETYKRSSIYQAKVLLGSIFDTELSWNYNGGLNRKISPLYQAIRSFDNEGIRSCALPFGCIKPNYR